jgi:hypothetical protein
LKNETKKVFEEAVFMEKFNLVKSYLHDMGLPIVSEDTEKQLVVVDDTARGIRHLVIDCEYPTLTMEQIIMKLNPQKNPAEFFKRLLQMNRHLVHGAFVLDDKAEMVLFRDTLELENLDRNELEGSVNALSLALSEYGSELLTYA